ncbi:hypothetical protein P9B03_07145 [Metasolibacillus meyeri]|uniref:N-acetyltransferase domain-containing protein n=1 Tax=Metasolibacillus meyeri TaxID=1071052 RepID=A0AAW9NU32_9BACL|nr:hypothetical protein [Metasolibacillus meyeri]MEC1178256.1 hypothetical protein [Metasolibacillus meyeri]
MNTTLNLYTYEILTKEQTAFIQKAAECLARTFIGVEVSGKWIQEPIVGQLNLNYEDFCTFTQDYLQSVVEQGYCAIALDADKRVVGVLAGDINKPEVIDEDLFEGSLTDMNVVMRVLSDVTGRFMADYEKRKGKAIQDGQLLHLFMLGVLAEHNRQEIVQQLAEKLFTKAAMQGVEAVIGEATNPKSMRLLEKFFGMTKYMDVEGNSICHLYQHNERLQGISPEIADGTYIIIREL